MVIQTIEEEGGRGLTFGTPVVSDGQTMGSEVENINKYRK